MSGLQLVESDTARVSVLPGRSPWMWLVWALARCVSKWTRPVEKRLEYTIQATASVWEPLEQVHYVVSGDVNFDSFGMAPWDAGGMHCDSCRLCGTCWKMMLQWLIWLSYRPVIVNGLDRTMRMNTEYGLDRIMMTNMDSPRLAVIPG